MDTRSPAEGTGLAHELVGAMKAGSCPPRWCVTPSCHESRSRQAQELWVLGGPSMVNGASRRSHDLEDEPRGKPQQVGCMRASASASLSRKGLSGKARTKTGIGKSDLPGLQGGPRKRDFVFMTKCARLGSIPTRRPSPGGIAAGCLDGGALARAGGQAGHASSPTAGTSFDACGRKTASGALRASTASC